MVIALIIPITIVSILGLSGYLLYKFVIYDAMCSRSVERMLNRFNIKKSQFQIIREYYEGKGESVSDRDIQGMVKHYRQNDPDQFLAMYEATRDRIRTDESC